jgi:hypothetical protein
VAAEMRAPVVFACLLMALTGCSDAPAPPAPTVTPEAGTTDETVAAGPLLADVTRDLHLTTDGRLTPQPADAGAMAVGLPVQQFATGVRGLVFVGETFSSPALLPPLAMTVVLNLRFDAPAVSNGGFDVGAWAGTTTTLPLGTFSAVAPVVAPGTTMRVEFTLEWGDQVGVHVPAGEAIRLVVTGPFTDPLALTSPVLVVGGDDPSRLNVTWSPYHEDPVRTGSVIQESFGGALTQTFSFVECDNDPGTTSATHELAIPVDVTSLEVTVRAASSQGLWRDLDLFLEDGVRVVAASRGPGSDDELHVAGVALEGLVGRTLVLRVVECQTGMTEYMATLTLRS